MNHPIVLSLEGNIGAGKSTILNALEKQLGKDSGWLFLKEPVHIWETIQDKDGKSILCKFYENPSKYAFSFQVMAFITRYQELKRMLKENPDCKGIICERSLEADKNIFAKMLHEDDLMDSMHYSIYDRYFQEYEGNYQLTGIVHIDATPETCFTRVKHRSRDGENNISFDYLQKCHDYHEKWLSNTKTPVLHLNVNANVSVNNGNSISLHAWIKRVLEFMELFEKKYNYL